MEDHTFLDFNAGFEHCIFKACKSFLRIRKIVSSCYKTDIIGLAFFDDVLRHVVHDHPVVGNDAVETIVDRPDAYDRRKALGARQVLYEFF